MSNWRKVTCPDEINANSLAIELKRRYRFRPERGSNGRELLIRAESAGFQYLEAVAFADGWICLGQFVFPEKK